MTNTYMGHPRTTCAARPCRSPLACEAADQCREARQGGGYEPMDTATAPAHQPMPDKYPGRCKALVYQRNQSMRCRNKAKPGTTRCGVHTKKEVAS